MPSFECHHCLRHAPIKYVSKKEFPLSTGIGLRSRCWGRKKFVNRNQEMKLILTIFISAILIQEVVPGTLIRFRRDANNSSSYLHTEYVAHIEQTGKNGNESYGKVSGKQAIERDNCNDDWNAFANKCAELIKDLVASLANAVSSKPGDATNLQLHIKNTFRHFDKTHNCSCLDDAGKGLSDIDLSHIFDNLTLSTAGPPIDNDDKGNSNNDAGDNGNLSSAPGINKQPQKLADGSSVKPEDEGDPNSTSNNRRHTNSELYEPYTGNTDESSEFTDNNNSLASGASRSDRDSMNEDPTNGALGDDNDDGNHDDGYTTILPVIAKDSGNDSGDCDDHTTIVPVVAIDNANGNDNGGGDDGNDDEKHTTVIPLIAKDSGNDNDDHTTIVPVVAIDNGNTNDNNGDDRYTTVVPLIAKDNDGGNDGNNESDPTVVVPDIVPSDSSNDDTGDEILITPRPAISVTQVPVIENHEIDQLTAGGDNSGNDGKDNGSTIPVVAINSQDAGDNKDSDYNDNSKNGILTTIIPVAVVPITDESRNGNGTSGSGDCGSGDCEKGNNGNDDQGNDTAVSETPVLVQPTTFQTTSKEPTSSPINNHQLPDFVSITTASTPQESHEGSENKQGNDDNEDYDDDCCSCESCTEEDEETDPKVVKQNVCKSLEEARKELRAIFDKIKKKLRCCRKGQQTITSNTSSVSS